MICFVGILVYFGVGLDQSEMWRSTGSFTCTFAQIIYLPLFKPIMWSFGPAIMPIVELLYWECYRKTKSGPKDYGKGIVIPYKPMIQPDCLGYFYIIFTSTIFLVWFSLSLAFLPLLMLRNIYWVFFLLMASMFFPTLVIPTVIFKRHFQVFRCCFCCYKKKEIMDANICECQGLVNSNNLYFSRETEKDLKKLQPKLTPGDLVLFQYQKQGKIEKSWRRGRLVSYEDATFCVTLLKDEAHESNNAKLKRIKNIKYAYEEEFWAGVVKSLMINELKRNKYGWICYGSCCEPCRKNIFRDEEKKDEKETKIEYYFDDITTKHPKIFIVPKTESEEDENKIETCDEEETDDPPNEEDEQSDLGVFGKFIKDSEELIMREELSNSELATKLELMTLKSLFVSYISGITIAVSAAPFYYLGVRFFAEIPNPFGALPPIVFPERLTIPDIVLFIPNFSWMILFWTIELFWPFPTTLRIEFQFLMIFSMGMFMFELLYLLIWSFYKISGAYRYKTDLGPVSCKTKCGNKTTANIIFGKVFKPCIDKSPLFWVPIMSLFVPLLAGRILYVIFFGAWAMLFGNGIRFLSGWCRITRPFQRHRLLEKRAWLKVVTSWNWKFVSYPIFADQFIICFQKLNCCHTFDKIFKKKKDVNEINKGDEERAMGLEEAKEAKKKATEAAKKAIETEQEKFRPIFLFIFAVVLATFRAILARLEFDHFNDPTSMSIFGSLDWDLLFYIPVYALDGTTILWILVYYAFLIQRTLAWKKTLEDYGNIGPAFGLVMAMFPFLKYLCCFSKVEMKRNKTMAKNVKKDLELLDQLDGSHISLNSFRQWLLNQENLGFETVDLSHCYYADKIWRKL